jgi:hypothetical protein
MLRPADAAEEDVKVLVALVNVSVVPGWRAAKAILLPAVVAVP